MRRHGKNGESVKSSEKTSRNEEILRLDFSEEIRRLEGRRGADQFLRLDQYGLQLIKVGGRYFLIDNSEYVGKGAYGSIFKAYPVDPKSGKARIERQFKAKIIFKDSSSALNVRSEFEAECKDLGPDSVRLVDFDDFQWLTRNQRGQVGLVTKPSYLLFSEYMPGATFLKRNERALEFVNRLGFKERLRLVSKLVSALYDFQSGNEDTPAFIHADLSGRNIVLHELSSMSGRKREVGVKIIDFGEARMLAIDRSTVKFDLNSEMLQPAITPPEVQQGKLGPKSDVYALVPTITFLLYGKSPFRFKNRTYTSIRSSASHGSADELTRMSSTPFYVDDICDEADCKLPLILRILIRQYLNCMQKVDYDDRVSTLEAKRFFVGFVKAQALSEGKGLTDAFNLEAVKVLLEKSRLFVESDRLTLKVCRDIVRYYEDEKKLTSPVLEQLLEGRLIQKDDATLLAPAFVPKSSLEDEGSVLLAPAFVPKSSLEDEGSVLLAPAFVPKSSLEDEGSVLLTPAVSLKSSPTEDNSVLVSAFDPTLLARPGLFHQPLRNGYHLPREGNGTEVATESPFSGEAKESDFVNFDGL